MKVVEFLYFYLMPETPGGSAGNMRELQRSPSKRLGSGGAQVAGTKTTEEKQGLLGKYLSNVEDLVEDLRESAPFGASVS